MSAYADDVTVAVLGTIHIEMIGTALKDYEAVAGAEFNQGRSVSLQLSYWRGKSMLSYSIIGCRTDRLIKLLGDLIQSRHPDGQELRQGDRQGSHKHPEIS